MRSMGSRLGAGVALLVVGALACSDDSGQVCGNGKLEPPEQCDDGNPDEFDACRLCVAYVPPRNVVKWEFNANAAPGFTSDGCLDVNASNVRVELTGPSTQSRDGGCTLRQVTFEELPAGLYTIAVTPLDSAGASLVTAPVTAMVEANVTPGTVVETVVNVGPSAWARPMTGTFYFVLRWAGMTCTMAAPPVAQQNVRLTIGGVPVTVSTSATTGHPSYRLDGTVDVTCVASTLGQAEAVDTLPFGPAQMTVVGKDGTGAVMFRGTFDTFVGAGRANPVLTLDVPSTIDAGIDAPVDAPTDAPVDAGVDAPLDAPPDA